MTTIPDDHKEDSLNLNPQEFIQLFEIELLSGAKVFAHSGREYIWQPPTEEALVTFESAFIKVDGVKRNSGEQRIRPTLSIGNPLDVFHVPVAQGALDGALVTRYRIRPENLEATPPVYEKNTWYVAQITSLAEVVTAQLRSQSDRQESQLPARQFLKPEFPSVSI